jgi:hypothetical protein
MVEIAREEEDERHGGADDGETGADHGDTHQCLLHTVLMHSSGT